MKTKVCVSLIVMLFSINCQQVGFVANSNVDGVDDQGGPKNNDIPNLLCSAGTPQGNPTQYYPTSCLINPNLPADSMGFQMNNLKNGNNPNFVELVANDALNGTNTDTELYFELATYTAPDSFVVTVEKSDGTTQEILNICHIRTYDKSDPTNNGENRPYSTNLLQFRVPLKKGARKLKFDFKGATTPTYLGVWNLNEFSVSLNDPATNPNPQGRAIQFRVQSGPLATYNDNTDPQQNQPYCQ